MDRLRLVAKDWLSEADDALRAEISALRREMDTIRGSLKDFGSEAYDTVKEKATMLLNTCRKKQPPLRASFANIRQPPAQC